MKSIIEQASSVMKAIEKAWNQADNPKDFSIKIFEKEEKNFFGITTKSAKIGIFFGDKPTMHDKSPTKSFEEIKECREEIKSLQKQQSQPAKHQSATATEQQPRNIQSTVQKKVAPPRFNNTQQNPAVTTYSQESLPIERSRRVPAVWSNPMIHSTESWLKKILSLMGMNTINFTTEITGKNLKFTFNAPLIDDIMHEKQLFRSFAHLIMSSLRNQYKQEIKDLKVVLIRPK